MNIAIVGFGTAGKHYFNILKKNDKINKIYIINDKKLNQKNFFNKYL